MSAAQSSASHSGIRIVVVDDHGDGASFAMGAESGSVCIGRSNENDIVLSDELISRRHARVNVTAHACEIEDLGSNNGVIVNGKSITTARRLRAGDLLRIGPTLLRFDSDRAADQPPMAPKSMPRPKPRAPIKPKTKRSLDQAQSAAQAEFALVCLSGTARGERYPLIGNLQVLGSASDCRPQLIGVRAKIATLTRSGDGYRIEAQPGTTDLRVSGGRKPPCLLVVGDLIDLGRSVFRLIRHDDASTAHFDPVEFDAPRRFWQRLISPNKNS